MRVFPRLGPPPDASLDGHRVDALMGFTAGVTGFFLLAVVLALGYLLYRYREKPGVRAAYERGDGPTHALAVAALSLLVFVAVDLSLVSRANADYARMRAAPRGPGVFRAEVMGRQWLWSARYAGPDGRFGTGDDVAQDHALRVPVGRPVVVQLAARDVIHSFFVPAFRVKQDAVPGRITQAWFQAERAGVYELACAELCGFAHYQMRARVVAMEPESLARWMARAEQDAAAAAAVTVAPGSEAARWGWDWVER